MALKERKEVWALPRWSETLRWYAKAIREMQTRSLNDPTSWRYLGAIHGYERSLDPYAIQNETMPSNTEQNRFWNQCKHNSGLFLSWHRVYLYYFEEIIRKTINDLGGPGDDWALPYWNYSAPGANARRLPPEFRDANDPDGDPNPLFIPSRPSNTNNGGVIAGFSSVNLTPCLTEPTYDPPNPGQGGSFGFGGEPRDSHVGGTMGSLEMSPHGSIHMAVGGFMQSFEQAGLDPIFWLHHCNIDRLWEVWIKRDNLHTNPPATGTWNNLRFEFHDADGNVASMTSQQVVNTTASNLNYRYDDDSDPLAGAMIGGGADMTPSQMAGATGAPITLDDTPTTASMQVASATGPALEGARAADELGGFIYLNIENITGQVLAPSYEVYLNLPEGAAPETRPDLCAGVLPMFGLREASGDNVPGGGLTYALEVGAIVRALRDDGRWDPDNFRVTFVPVLQEGSAERVHATPVEVGRVSIYYS